MNDRVIINQMPSGVPGLDSLLGGGLPELCFNVNADDAGSGKTNEPMSTYRGILTGRPQDTTANDSFSAEKVL